MLCVKCIEIIHPARADLGYIMCLDCGEKYAKKVKHTIAPIHKSCYQVQPNKEELVGINNKGGLVR